MESTKKLLGFLLLLWITSDAADSFPDSFSKNEISSSRNIVGISSQIIANALLQGQADSNSNYICSPLGYSTILAILAEGSKGRTRDEIFQVLEQPTKNIQDMRSAYRSVLFDFAGNDSIIAPQFKTWFYIYKPNSALEDFKRALIDNYLVEVKDIEKLDFDFGSTRSEQDQYMNDLNNKDILDFDDLKQNNPTDESSFDSLKIVEIETSIKDAIADYDQIDKEEKSKVSKFDKEVDEKQYVEKSEIPTEVVKEEDTTTSSMMNENESGPEKFVLPIKKFLDDSMEIMEAQENRNFANGFGRAQPLHLLGDVTSALSGNAIMGRKLVDSKELESKMLLFNGLYFRGEWAQKFDAVEELKTFNSYKEKQETKFIKSNGLYKYAEIASQNLIAVEIPYKNDRFTLLLIMPNTLNDMKQHCKQSNYNHLNEIVGQMELANLNLHMPRFRFECTSRAEKALGKLGITTLFTSKADLSGVAENSKGFQIEELVQHVAIRIDEASSSESVLSAGNIQGRQNEKATEVLINKPFMFYVRDTTNDIVLTAGKIMDIPNDEELAINFNI